MTTANKLTILRVVMIPAFLAVVYWGFPGSTWVALAIYIVACLTDWRICWRILTLAHRKAVCLMTAKR